MVLAFLIGCAADFQDVTQEQGAIGTVVDVSWWSPIEAEGRVIFQTPAGQRAMPARQTAEDGGFRYEATLLGLTSDAQRSGRIQLLDEQGLVSETPIAVQAGRLDMVLPAVTTTTINAPFQGLLLTSFLRNPAAPVLLNEAGEVVWALPVEDDFVVSEARLHPDGGQIIYGVYQHGSDSDDGDEIVRASLDGNTVVRTPTPGQHHDFTVLPDGTVAYIAYDARTINGASVQGDRIMELSEDGTLVEVWSAWDTIPYAEDTPSDASGWTHANALNYDPASDAYLLSVHNYNTILKIDRASGEIIWALGGPLSDFDVPEDATFRRQHGSQLLDDDHIVVFDNGSVAEGVTEVHEYRLDFDAMTAEPVWHYQPEDAVYTMTFGDVERLPDGDTLITFCGSGLIEEVDGDGDVKWRMEAPFGAGFGYSTHFEDPEELLD